MSGPDPDPASLARRSPTAAEARALGHPTRLRIVFACRERARTNKELAEEIGTTPGTIHYHLRPLVAEGFLVPEEPRPGPRGSREQPYRATGKTWEISGTPEQSRVLREVGAQELLAAPQDALLSLARLGVSLPEGELHELLARFEDLLEEARSRSRDTPEGVGDGADGRGVVSATILLAVHRQGPGEPST